MRQTMSWNILASVLISALVAVGGSTCGGEPQRVEELSFTVVDSLLGARIADSTLGFSFRPPAGWKRIPDSTLEAMQERLSDIMVEVEGVGVTPIAMYVDFASGSSCCLSQVDGVDLSGRTPDPLRIYESLIEAKFSGEKIDKGLFRVNGVNVVQFLIADARVVFKLLCSGPRNRTFQVDFIIPRSVYLQKLKAIESSMGSFQTIP